MLNNIRKVKDLAKTKLLIYDFYFNIILRFMSVIFSKMCNVLWVLISIHFVLYIQRKYIIEYSSLPFFIECNEPLPNDENQTFSNLGLN